MQDLSVEGKMQLFSEYIEKITEKAFEKINELGINVPDSKINLVFQYCVYTDDLSSSPARILINGDGRTCAFLATKIYLSSLELVLKGKNKDQVIHQAHDLINRIS